MRRLGKSGKSAGATGGAADSDGVAVTTGWVAGWLVRVYRWLLIGLAPALYLAYFPVIRLGSDATMNYELSVAEIWLVMLDVVGALAVIARGGVGEMVRKWGRRKWMWLFLPLMVTASVIWSANAVRGWLTVAMMWAIVVAVVVVWELRGVCGERWRSWWWRVWTGSTLLVCGWCVVQCVLDVLGVSREVTGMCAGCVSEMFGFPHPNGFAVEPQFMGNLLLAPGIVMAAVVVCGQGFSSPSGLEFFSTSYAGQPRKVASEGGDFLGAVRNIREKNSNHFMMAREKLGHILATAIFMLVTATIFLTFSRGAIYAFLIGVVVLSAYYMVKWKVWKGVMVVWGVIVAAFVLVLNLQGVMTMVGPTEDGYVDGVARAINHLTLGVVEVRGKTTVEGGENKGSEEAEGRKVGAEEGKVDDSPSLAEVGADAELEGLANEAVFDGYVEESTATRVRLNDVALAVWRQDFATMVAGVGIGGAGVAMYEAGLTPTPKEIVQNEYISLLLETGVVGMVLFIVLAVGVMVVLVRRRAVVVIVMLVAYGVTLLFFSGLPNALQVYLVPVMVLAFCCSTPFLE